MIQKTFDDFGDHVSGKMICKSCRKRSVAIGVQCKICLRLNGSSLAAMERKCVCCRKRKRFTGKQCKKCYEKSTASTICKVSDEWDVKIMNVCTGLRQRSDRNKVHAATSSQLKQKLVIQEYKCYFTGHELRPDKSLRLAHLVSLSNGGTSEIDNLVWTTHDVNRMQGTMNEQEFLQFCISVANNHAKRIEIKSKKIPDSKRRNNKNTRKTGNRSNVLSDKTTQNKGCTPGVGSGC